MTKKGILCFFFSFVVFACVNGPVPDSDYSKLTVTLSSCPNGLPLSNAAPLRLRVWYFPPDRNGDDAVTEVESGRMKAPADTFRITRDDFDATDRFRLRLPAASVCVLYAVTERNGQAYHALFWLTTTNRRNTDHCFELKATEVIYEDEPEATKDERGGRLAPSDRRSVAYKVVTNDLTIAQRYTVKLWHFGDREPVLADKFDGSAVDALGKEARNRPTVHISKNDLRLYGIKTLKTGWWIATHDEGVWYRFRVASHDKGLLWVNSENNPPFLDGYAAQSGRLKVSLWNGLSKPQEVRLYVLPPNHGDQPRDYGTSQSIRQSGTWFHLFARDGSGTNRAQTLMLPAGRYMLLYESGDNDWQGGIVTVAPGSRVPHLRMRIYD